MSASAMDNLNATLDNRHKLALPYWARPGIRLAAKGSAGTPGKGGDEDDEDDEDDDPEDDEDDDPDADKTPEELKAELAKARVALKRANGESERGRKNLRGRVAELEKELDEARAPKDDDAKGKVDEKALAQAVTKAKKEGYNDGLSVGTKRVMNAEARSALVARGASAAKVAKLTSLIDFGELELDDDGVIGLDDAVDELVNEWPELFQTPRPRRIGGKSGRGSEQRDEDKKPLTATERQVLALEKGRR